MTLAGQAIDKAADVALETVGGPARLQVVLLLGAILGLDAADKAAISALAGSLRGAFHIQNTDIGILIAAVSFSGAIFTLPAGILADLTNRKRLLLISIALWTAAEVISGTASSFIYLLVLRLILGALTATAAPTIATLVGDFFPPQARGRAYGMILGGELVGAALGFVLATEVSVALDWHWGLYAMAIPGIVLLMLLSFFLVEPARGGQSWIRFGQRELSRQGDSPDQCRPAASNKQTGTKSQETVRPETLAREHEVPPRSDLVLTADPTRWSMGKILKYLLHIPTYVLLIIASTLGYYFFAGVRSFAMIFLTEHFQVSRTVAVWLAAIVGLGALLGVLAGGRISQALLNRGRIDARIIVPGLALVLAVLALAPGIWAPNTYVGVALLCLGFFGLAGANPPIDAARLDVVPSALWGRGEAGRMSLRGLFEGGAPILFGFISDVFGGGARGLQFAFFIMLVPVLIAASLALPARRTYQRDVATADASVRSLRQRHPTR